MQKNYMTNAFLINSLESKNNKIISDIKKSVDIVGDHVNKELIFLPDVPDNLLTFDPSLIKNIRDVSRRVDTASDIGLSKDIFLTGLASIGFDLLSFLYRYERKEIIF